MADWIQTAAPFSVRVSSDPAPTTGWVVATRAQADSTRAIPAIYRKGTAPAAVVEMTRAEKDAVDAALLVAEKNAGPGAATTYVKALKKEIRAELNILRKRVDLVSEGYRTESGVSAPTILDIITGSEWSANIRTRMDN